MFRVSVRSQGMRGGNIGKMGYWERSENGGPIVTFITRASDVHSGKGSGSHDAIR